MGDTVEGRITRLASFGAFMELAPGVEGMIHLSELSWSRVNSADEAVAVGDMVRAKLLSVSKDDKGRTRISLSRKKAEGDPWLQAADRLALVRGDMFTPPCASLPSVPSWNCCPAWKAWCTFPKCPGPSA